jgi:hypothetical protein
MMMSNRHIIAIILTIALVTSCKKENLDDCFTTPGNQITEERPVSYFHAISMYENVNLIISQGDHFSIEVSGAENLVKSVGTVIKDSVLVITNDLSCNWARSYKHKLDVHITSPALKSIRYESSGDISTSGLVQIDTLEINVWGGGGSVNINVDCNRLNMGLHYGTVDFKVTGKSKMTTIYANSYGPFFCGSLDSDIVYIRNQGTNNCYVHANHILEAEITNIGSIYYTGNPFELKCIDNGEGEFVKL